MPKAEGRYRVKGKDVFRTCVICQGEYPIKAFHVNPLKGAESSMCKCCFSERKRERMDAYAEENRERERNWPFKERIPCGGCFEMKLEKGGSCGCDRREVGGEAVANPTVGKCIPGGKPSGRGYRKRSSEPVAG